MYKQKLRKEGGKLLIKFVIPKVRSPDSVCGNEKSMLGILRYAVPS